MLHFLPDSFTEERSTWINSDMQGLVLIRVGVGWLAYMAKIFELNYNIMLYIFCRHTPESHNTTWLNLWGGILYDTMFASIDDFFHLK